MWGRVPYGKDRSRQNQRHVKTRFRIDWTVDTDRHGGHKVWNCGPIIMGLKMHVCGHRKWEISIGCLPKSHTDIKQYKKFITRRHWSVKEWHRFWPWVNIHNMFWKGKPDPPHGRVGKRPQQQLPGFAGSSLCGAKMMIPEKIAILAKLFDKDGATEINWPNNNYY